jgi:hypothetical protein
MNLRLIGPFLLGFTVSCRWARAWRYDMQAAAAPVHRSGLIPDF